MKDTLKYMFHRLGLAFVNAD